MLLVWTRLILPNGRSIVLERQPGADEAGYAGLEDGVDYHWGQLLRAAGLATILNIGLECRSARPRDRPDPRTGEADRAYAGTVHGDGSGLCEAAPSEAAFLAWTRARLTNRLSAGLSFSGRQTSENCTLSSSAPMGTKATFGY